MQVGSLSHRVTVQTSTEVSDGHEGSVVTWADTFRRVAAHVEPLQGRDLENARQIDPRISHKVHLRYWRAYPTDLDGGRTRLVYHDLEDRTFDVVSPPVDVDERHVALELLCREMA